MNFSDLNEAQLSAVTSNSQYQLVLAGAGSGKTKVLVNKIAWLMREHGISPYEILSLTFTNKAAKNMLKQLESILMQNISGMWMGTFHGIAHRILRRHALEINLDPNFQVIDQKEQQQIIKSIYKNFSISEQKWPVNKTAYIIQKYKSQGLRSGDVSADTNIQEQYVMIYKSYEELCINGHLLDFTELLLKTLETLKTNSEIQSLYHSQFSHVMIDEFQDTNLLQFELMQALTGSNTNIMAVGDDDQSIYSWRGASVDHMHNFSSKGCEITRLEQNYRSTQKILNAANCLISNNSNRLGKTLWSNNDTEEDIITFASYNDIDEANFVTESILDLISSGTDLEDIAVLYRSNAQSRVLEEQLNRAGVPYRIYGGLRFFDRMEIKDVLAYLSLCVSRNNDAAFERVINKPVRGIGSATIAALREETFISNCSLFSAIETAKLSKRARSSIDKFTDLIERLANEISGLELHEAIDHIAHVTGLIALYEEDEPHQASSRLENIQELMHAASLYSETEGNKIASFISEISLEPIESSEQTSQVQLMTVHSAKGLEFDSVFVTGLEEGLFPHQMSMQENGLEEERRLCYVAITRAKRKLHLSYAQTRRLNGKVMCMRKSRFLSELSSNQEASQRSTVEFHLGQNVNHKKFGNGIIINSESDRIQVHFKEHGAKWILATFLESS